MSTNRITLAQGIRFHGHLGPYLVLGVLAGELAVKKLKCKKYFGLKVKVWGATLKPRSCLIDGLQLSTGATYGKGNIEKLDGARIKIQIHNLINRKKIIINFNEDLVKQLEQAKTHKDSELLAKKIYKAKPKEIFKTCIR